MTIGTMSQKRGVDAPAATGIITRLEQNGLVERRHNREGRRVVKVYLTDEGRDISHSVVASVEHFEQSLKHGFSESELDRFLVQLQQLDGRAHHATHTFLQQPKFSGFQSRLSTVAHPQLAQNVAEVVLDGAPCYVEGLTDLAIGSATCKQSQDLSLALGQL